MKELPETLEVRKSRDCLMMNLEEAQKFFGITFKKPLFNKVFVRMFFRFRIMRYGIGYAIPHFLSRE